MPEVPIDSLRQTIRILDDRDNVGKWMVGMGDIVRIHGIKTCLSPHKSVLSRACFSHAFSRVRVYARVHTHTRVIRRIRAYTAYSRNYA